MSDSEAEAELSDGSDDDEAFLLLLLMAMKTHGKRKRGGSKPGKAANLERGFEEAHTRLWNDYFCENPVYPEKLFRRRHRMSRALFVRIMGAVVGHDADFEQRTDALGRKGLSPLQKCSAAIRMLVYGCSADMLDESIRGAESTILAYTKKFCKAVVDLFEDEYLREPTSQDIERQLDQSPARGFPGCIGSLDCMHWRWELCPAALKGQLSGKEGKPTVVLEAVADHRMWIWHLFFGAAGSNNDINIIDRSRLLNQHVINHARYDSFSYVVAGKTFHQLYYLVDGIYPPYACFVASISKPSTARERRFANRQEAVRKDVERAFGVLQSRFRILKMPSRICYAKDMLVVMKACIIMHNMIIEDEWEVPGLEDLHLGDGQPTAAATTPNANLETQDSNMELAEFITRRYNMQSKASNGVLRGALMDHLWHLKGLEGNDGQ